MSLFGLIGNPLSHSFSKKYFTEKFEREGLPHEYRLFPMNDLAGITELISRYPNLAGINVTIPFKKDILPFLNDRQNLPVGLAACNCIRITNGAMCGYNTDIIGFEKALFPHLTRQVKQALVLGNGGAAEAVKYVLKKWSLPYQVAGRTRHYDTTITYEEMDESIIAGCKLIINTTPLGMEPMQHLFPRSPITVSVKRIFCSTWFITRLSQAL